MKVVVTCGPSYEPIDQVRRITNLSTGRLGTALANALAQAGCDVICLKGEQATCEDPLRVGVVHRFSTNQDLADRLEILGCDNRVDAIFHAAALCDFRVQTVRDEQGREIVSEKFPTRGGQLHLVLVPTIKVLPRLRDWFPAARIVGWKYEVAGSRAEALEKAFRQLRESRSDACVLNGSAYGPGFAWCTPDGKIETFADQERLIEGLARWIGCL